MPSLQPVIGLEVHAQLLTRSKLFCSCRVAYGDEPNRHVCPICLGHPGVLPLLNRRAVELAIRTAIALRGAVHTVSAFARKNYFYPDLPKNYQITQFDRPLCDGGAVEIGSAEIPRSIRVERVHLEEDAGKSRHKQHPSAPTTRIDLNRCGIPLIEIVTKPEIHSPKEARTLLSRLRRMLIWLDVCDGNMEEGSLRCDANVSLREKGTRRLGTRTEIKNLNSLRFLERALDYEIGRQRLRLEQGAPILRETRMWDEAEKRTRKIRGKEEIEDYRYFPDPDLPPLVISDEWIERIAVEMPELPAERRRRLVAGIGLPDEGAEWVQSRRSLADYFEAVVDLGIDAKLAADWVSTKLVGELKEAGLAVDRSPLTPASFASLLGELAKSKMSARQAKELLRTAIREREEPLVIVETQKIEQISDPVVLSRWIEICLDAHPDEVVGYLAGKQKILHFLIGKIQEIACGRANPKQVTLLLREHLERRREA